MATGVSLVSELRGPKEVLPQHADAQEQRGADHKQRTGEVHRIEDTPIDSNTYIVESGIPIPDDVRIKYPFAEMKVGDSFRLKADKEKSVRSAASAYCNRNKGKGFRFILRQVAPDVWRCWRFS